MAKSPTPKKTAPRKLSDEEVEQAQAAGAIDPVDEPTTNSDSVAEPAAPEDPAPVQEPETPTAPQEDDFDPGDPNAPLPEGVEFNNQEEAEAMEPAAPPAVAAADIPRPAAPPPRGERPQPKPFQFPQRVDTRLPPGKIKKSTALFNGWSVLVPVGTDAEDVFDAIYFGHYIRGAYVVLNPLDTINIICEDMSWEVNVRVLSVSEAEVRVSPISQVFHHSVMEQGSASEYQIRTIGPRRTQVIHLRTGQVVRDNLASEADAFQFLAGHTRAVAR